MSVEGYIPVSVKGGDLATYLEVLGRLAAPGAVEDVNLVAGAGQHRLVAVRAQASVVLYDDLRLPIFGGAA